MSKVLLALLIMSGIVVFATGLVVLSAEGSAAPVWVRVIAGLMFVASGLLVALGGVLLMLEAPSAAGEAEEPPPLPATAMLAEYIRAAHATARDKGWWDEEREFGTQLALMHSELSEALEAHRNGAAISAITLERDGDGRDKPEGVAVEFADVLIRIFDTCARYNIPLEDALVHKMEYNKTRPYRHGGKRC